MCRMIGSLSMKHDPTPSRPFPLKYSSTSMLTVYCDSHYGIALQHGHYFSTDDLPVFEPFVSTLYSVLCQYERLKKKIHEY